MKKWPYCHVRQTEYVNFFLIATVISASQVINACESGQYQDKKVVLLNNF